MSGETLKPCPWCGGEAEISQIGNEHTKSRGFEVKCKTWDCSTVKRALVVRHTMAEARLFAVERWNTRPTPTVEGGELVERLRTELAEAKDAARRSDQHAQRVAVEAADGFAAMEALDEFWDAVGHPNNRGTLTPAEQVASICRELDQAADALASRDAEIERLRGELRRAHLKRLVELSEEFGGYDELSTSALSTLKTAREGNNA